AQASALLLALVMVAPQKQGSAPALPGGIHELPTPFQFRSKIEQSLKIGHQIYVQDAVAAQGTDVLEENIGSHGGPKWSRVGVYLTIPEPTIDKTPPQGWVVLFYTRAREPRLAYRIRLWPDRKDPPQFEAFEPAVELSADVSRMVRARA